MWGKTLVNQNHVRDIYIFGSDKNSLLINK